MQSGVRGRLPGCKENVGKNYFADENIFARRKIPTILRETKARKRLMKYSRSHTRGRLRNNMVVHVSDHKLTTDDLEVSGIRQKVCSVEMN
jgi:hypothetical protein